MVTTASSATTDNGYTYTSEGDILLGSILVVCSVTGLLGNVSVLLYFVTRAHKDLSTRLYICISACNLAYCLMVPFVAATFLSGRDPAMFKASFVCIMWAFVFHILQRIIMFLIGTLSFVRTISLVYPLKEIKIRDVFVVVGCYFGFLLLKDAIFTGISLRKSSYHKNDGYCYTTNDWKHPAYSTFNVVDTVFYCIEVALPIPAVFVSCIISIVFLSGSRKQEIFAKGCFGSDRSASKLIKATETIIIFSICHLCCNLPMLGNYICWTVTSQKFSWPGPIYSNSFMIYYSWCVSDVACLAINTVIDPIIFLTRIQAFKRWIKRGLTKLFFGIDREEATNYSTGRKSVRSFSRAQSISGSRLSGLNLSRSGSSRNSVLSKAPICKLGSKTSLGSGNPGYGRLARVERLNMLNMSSVVSVNGSGCHENVATVNSTDTVESIRNGQH